MMVDWYSILRSGFPGWELSESDGHRYGPAVRLAITNKIDRSSKEITREFDDIAQGCFYFREWSRDGSVFIRPGEVYDAGWWFQKRDDADEFVKRYGGMVELACVPVP